VLKLELNPRDLALPRIIVSMANNVDLKFAGITDSGLVRSQNEDAIAISPDHGCAVLADGMGGYNAGEIASGMATAVIKDLLEQGIGTTAGTDEATQASGRRINDLLIEAIQRANTIIFEAARAEPEYHGMGTTLVAAVFQGDKVTVAHVGDSRAYRLRQNDLARITRDHSLLQEQIDAGLIDPALARYSHTKNLVTRAVGVAMYIDVEIHDHYLQSGDVYLFCSDGLSDMLSDDEISEILVRQGELEPACRALVQKANDNGGFDNISVILVRVLAVSAQPPSLLGRILNWVS
jgi:PPM family protein phosphatase